MLQIPAIFSDNALFQQTARLTIRGRAAPMAPVRARLTGGEGCFDSALAAADEAGCFELTLKTPQASFERYRFTLTDGETVLTKENWLFGELWLAAGQSNMKLANVYIADRAAFYEKLRGKEIRAYYQTPGLADVFPEEPDDSLDGAWCTVEDALFEQVSACGSAAAVRLYDYLNRGAQIPVGIVHCNRGATYIESWLPREVIQGDTVLSAFLEKRGRLPYGGRWNSFGEFNYQQASAQFNRKIAPLLGVQLRGVLWYQGENNVGDREDAACYRRMLLLYQEVYQKLFRIEGEAVLPVICSQIYAYSYRGSDPIDEGEECRGGYLNEAIVQAAAARPEAIAAVPIYDLKPLWGAARPRVPGVCHPIHPTHKYPLGDRLGEVALAKAYGADGMETAAYWQSKREEDGSLVLTFHVGRGSLHTPGSELRGLYLCGDNGVYQEAQAQITGRDTLRLTHPFIPHPRHAAYQYAGLAWGGRLYAGNLPVAPFATDRENAVRISPKPWLHTEQQAVWVQEDVAGDGVMDFFYRPIWHPLEGSELCPDDVFCRTKAALRIQGQGESIGAYVKAYPGYPLDLPSYKALRLWVFDYTDSILHIQAELPDGTGGVRLVEYPCTVLSGDAAGWTALEADFSAAETGPAKRLLFRFEVGGKRPRAVNMDGLQLIAR